MIVEATYAERGRDCSDDEKSQIVKIAIGPAPHAMIKMREKPHLPCYLIFVRKDTGDAFKA
jgi:hypothetical protein